MNLGELRNLIRAEAGIQGLDEYSALIDAILSQELRAATGKGNFEELRSDVTTIVTTADAQHDFTLPVDFQTLACANFMANSQSNSYPLYSGRAAEFNRSQNGSPRFFIIQGTDGAKKLRLYPFSSVVIGDSLVFEYYKLPNLTLDTDIFPVPSLEKSIQQAVMARLLRQVDTKRAQMAKAEANQGFSEARAENAGNA